MLQINFITRIFIVEIFIASTCGYNYDNKILILKNLCHINTATKYYVTIKDDVRKPVLSYIRICIYLRIHREQYITMSTI